MAREVSDQHLKSLARMPSVVEARGLYKGDEMHAIAYATALSNTTSALATPQVVQQRQQKAKSLKGSSEVDTLGSLRMASLKCAPNRMVITSMLQPVLSNTDLHQNLFANKCGALTQPFVSSPPKAEKPAPDFQAFSGLRLHKQSSREALLRGNEAIESNDANRISRVSDGATASETPETPERQSLLNASIRNGSSMHTGRCRLGGKGHKLAQSGLFARLHPATRPLVCSIPPRIWPQHQQKEMQKQQGACRPAVNPVLQRMSLLNSQGEQRSLGGSLRKCSALEGRLTHLISHSHSHTPCRTKIKTDRETSSEQPAQQSEQQWSRNEMAPTAGNPMIAGEATNMNLVRLRSYRGTNPSPCAEGSLDGRLDVSDDNTQLAQTVDTEASTAASGVAPSVQIRPPTPSSVQRLYATTSKHPLVNVTLPVPTPFSSTDSKSAKVMPTSAATKTALTSSTEVARPCYGSSGSLSSCPVNTASSPGMSHSPSRATCVTKEKFAPRRAQLESALRKSARPQDSAGRPSVEGRCDGDAAGVPQPPVTRRLTAALATQSPRRDVAVKNNAEVKRWLRDAARDNSLMRKQLNSDYAARLSSGLHFLDFAPKGRQEEHYEEEEDDPWKHGELARLEHTTISFVCVDSLMSLLERCCCISHFGPDEHLQQKNDLATSPFHCSSRPQISLEEYLVKRIFRHGRLCMNEGILAIALLSRFLCSQNAALTEALQSCRQSKQQQKEGLEPTEGTNSLTNLEASGHSMASPSTLHSKAAFAATAARIGFVEFNYLTAHRLLLTAALLAKKTHRDEHTNIKHWAQLGGIPVEDLVETESAFLHAVAW
ncbi:hypothetical protein Emed_000088 [Eimeria media]